MTTKISRRTVLLRGMQIPLGGAVLFGLGACGGSAGGGDKQAHAACVDPASLGEGELSMRNAAHYTDNAPNPQQACVGCAFFHGTEAQGGCAQCDILHSQVSEKGHCDSWSAKS
jgi:hypothetical protein